MDATQMLAFMADGIQGKEIFYLIASIVLLISAIVLIVVVLIQSNSSKGLSGAIAGGSDTFYGRTKGNSVEKKLAIVTIVVAIVFALISLGVYSVQSNLSIEDWWNQLIQGNGSSTSTEEVRDEEPDETETPGEGEGTETPGEGENN